MFPSQNLNIDVEALSGICGSISIACWVVVFSPQIIENFRRSSADGLSLLFLAVWLAGDVFNILGSVLQGVLPTMTILAVYYTLADIVLLGQCFYYRGFTLSDDPSPSPPENGAINGQQPDEEDATAAAEDYLNDTETPSPVIARKPTEHTSLLSSAQHNHTYQDSNNNNNNYTNHLSSSQILPAHSTHPYRRHSASSFLHPSVDGTHLSPATPFIEPPLSQKHLPQKPPRTSISTLQTTLFNLSAIGLVCAAGILGWYVSPHHSAANDDKPPPADDNNNSLTFDPLGQVFGYLCAVLYLGSRLPQILLNYRRKSTEGVSLLFFLFACIGNLTYVLSILAYSPVCGREGRCRRGEIGELYARYILVNLSWLIGSFGTLFLDMCIFIQFFLYMG